MRHRHHHSFPHTLAPYAHIGYIILRVFIGIRLVYGVMDNVLHYDHMVAFSNFLDQFGFPFPTICAYTSVYLQLVSGILFIAGWQVRWAALAMVLNFLVALIMVHRNDSFEATTPALMILFCSLYFLLQGDRVRRRGESQL